MTIIVDTGGLLAAFDESEPKHDQCASVIAADRGPFVISPFVVAELDYMVLKRLGIDAEIAFLQDVAVGRYALAAFDDRDMTQALSVVEQYRDLAIGVTDALLVVLAARYRTTRLLTLNERHFRTVVPLRGGDGFTLLPADADEG